MLKQFYLKQFSLAYVQSSSTHLNVKKVNFKEFSLV